MLCLIISDAFWPGIKQTAFSCCLVLLLDVFFNPVCVHELLLLYNALLLSVYCIFLPSTAPVAAAAAAGFGLQAALL